MAPTMKIAPGPLPFNLALVTGWLSPVFAGLDWSRSINWSTALGVVLSLFGRPLQQYPVTWKMTLSARLKL